MLSFVFYIIWISSNIIQSSRGEDFSESFTRTTDKIGEENSPEYNREFSYKNTSHVSVPTTQSTVLDKGDGLASNENSDSCYNNRGYPSVESCVEDCKHRQEELSMIIYNNKSLIKYKVLHLTSGEFRIDSEKTIHIPSWNEVRTSDFYWRYNNDSVTVCLPLYDLMETCPEGHIQPSNVGFRDNEHTLWLRILHKEFAWNEFFYYRGKYIICSPPEVQSHATIVKWHLVGSFISAISLCIALILSKFFPFFGKNVNLICHMVMLTLAYITQCLLLLIKSKADSFCITITVLFHFFLLSSFLWMNVHAFDLYLAIKSIASRKKFSIRRFLISCLISWGIPFVLMALAVIAELCEIHDMMPGFREHCGFKYGLGIAFAYYYTWTTLSIVINIIIFILIVYTFRKASNEVASVNRKIQKKLFFVTIKLVVVMGFIWIFEILIWAEVGDTLVMSWIDILTSFQGLLIVLVYFCRVKLLKKAMSKFKALFKKKDENISMRTEASKNSSSSTIASISL